MKYLFAILLCLISYSTTAEIYKWTDKQGVVHYEDKQPETSDKIPPAKVEKMELSPIQILDDGSVKNSSKENQGMFSLWLATAQELKTEMIKKINVLLDITPVVTNETIAANEAAAKQAPVIADKKNVVEIYTASWCGACKKAKKWLTEHNVTYREYDVERDSKAALRMRKLGGGNGVPFTVINGKTFQGFDPDSYQAALN